MSTETRGPRVNRPTASATWEHRHHWGSQFGDSTTLYVIRNDGGAMSIHYGKNSIEIREELVLIVAAMVAAAAVWTDAAPPAGEADDVIEEADRG